MNRFNFLLIIVMILVIFFVYVTKVRRITIVETELSLREKKIIVLEDSLIILDNRAHCYEERLVDLAITYYPKEVYVLPCNSRKIETMVGEKMRWERMFTKHLDSLIMDMIE